MKTQSHLKIVLAGHVDHGKSTLIGRLLLDTKSLSNGKIREIRKISKELGHGVELAYLTDQLKEERENSMTMDTTQIFFKTRRTGYTIIDSPGHVVFIRNMLTGASQANAAMLVIDTSEGIKEQTCRHAYLVNMLSIKNIIVLFNKMDLVGYKKEEFLKKKGELFNFFKSLGIKPLFMIPISAKAGINISKKSRLTPWYKGKTLLEALDSITLLEESKQKPLRLPIQDIYEINSDKVIVGQILSGHIREGQRVTLLPSFKQAVVRSIRIFDKTTKEASEGENIGLILDDPSHAKRGAVIVQTDNLPAISNTFSGHVFWINGAPLKVNASVTIRCATQALPGKVKEIKERMDSSSLKIIEAHAKELRINEAGIVTFTIEKPAVLEPFDGTNSLGRFIIEQANTINGAGILIQSK